MIKGCAKRVVVVKDIDSNLFEEAFFIVRPGNRSKKYAEEDFLGEAGRLVKAGSPTLSQADGSAVQMQPESSVPGSGLRENAFSVRTGRRRILRDCLMFLFGFGVSAVFCTLIYYAGTAL